MTSRGARVRPFVSKLTVAGGAAALILSLVPSVALAQAVAGPNQGAVSVAGGLDVPSVYVFRGVVQERTPKLTLFPYADLGVRLSGDSATGRGITLHAGVWNSLNTGSSGSKGFTAHTHYEEDFYSTLSVGIGSGLTVDASYTAYTSPNLMFTTVHEASVKLSSASRFHPYGLAGFDLGSGSLDGGQKKGIYVELGGEPAFHLGRLLLGVPVKVGLSGSHYYELDGVDHRFGFADAGGRVTLPLTVVPARFGAWNVHGGAEYLAFGTTTKSLNAGAAHKVVVLGGIGLSY